MFNGLRLDPVEFCMAAVVLALEETPENGTEVAAMVPEPEVFMAQPVPQVKVEDVFVPPPNVAKAAPPTPRPLK